MLSAGEEATNYLITNHRSIPFRWFFDHVGKFNELWLR